MKRYQFIGLLIMIILIGCAQDTKKEENLVSIVVDWNSKDLDYSHWVEDSTLVVPLETKDDCLIGEITYLVYQNHKIYIADNLSKTVYIFDETGRLLSKLRAPGNGPKEYLEIAGFVVHNSQLVIYDKMKKKIFFYAEDGSFLNEKDASKVWGTELFCIGNDLYLFNNSSNSDMGYYHLFKLNLTDRNSEFEAFLPFEDQGNAVWGIARYSCTDNNEALFTTWPYDMMYVVSKGETYPAYKVDFGEKRLPEQFMKNGYEALQVAQRDNYITGIHNIQQTDRYIFISCSGQYIIIYDKEKGQTMTTEKFYNKNLGGTAMGTLSNTYLQNSCMLTYTNMSDFVLPGKLGWDWDKQYFKYEYIRGLFKGFQQMNEEDNPVIIIQKIKEDVALF